MTGPGEDRPVLRIVRGDASDEEVAALAAVLAAASGGDTAGAGPRSAWAEHASLVRAPVRPGPGAWRASGLPR